jgi:hypothetical protein
MAAVRPIWLPRHHDIMPKNEERLSMALLERLSAQDGPPPLTAVIKHIYLAYDQDGYFLSRSVDLCDEMAPVEDIRKWWIYYQDTRREVVFHKFTQITLEKQQYSEVNMPYACYVRGEDGLWRCSVSAVP